MVELLLPAGNIECLRAAVANGADAVYIGLDHFSARANAGNFSLSNIKSVISYCHERTVSVYVALNTLIKNGEVKDYIATTAAVDSAGADAIIIQDINLIPLIRQNSPHLQIHISTQAGIMNVQSIPKEADRVILPRELTAPEISEMSEHVETEIFVHGALCISLSGQCFFSSIAGGRSGNRGYCAQPCRKRYNNKYLLSTMDLCMLEKLDTLRKLGVSSFKIEGRMKSPRYVGQVAKIYRNVIDTGRYSEDDIKALKIVFNREFTTGFMENDSIIDSRKPMNRGLFIGRVRDNTLKVKEDLYLGDGIAVWSEDTVKGITIDTAYDRDSLVTIKAPNYSPAFLTSSSRVQYDKGDAFTPADENLDLPSVRLPLVNPAGFKDIRIYARAYSSAQALRLDGAADVIYCDIEDYPMLIEKVKTSQLYCTTPRIVSTVQADSFISRLKEHKVFGVLASNRAFLNLDMDIHVDYTLNTFNDYDIRNTPIISPELSLAELATFTDKRFICLIHGFLVLMTTKEPLRAPELIDDAGRHFPVRKEYSYTQVLNSRQLGLFNRIRELLDIGIRHFYIDSTESKWVNIYRRIIAGTFDDCRIKKGYTTGNYFRRIA